MILFPSRLFHHYKNPLALWLYARHIDERGSGQAIFSLESAARSLNFAVQTLKGWLCEGKKMGLWRYYDTNQILGMGAWVKLFYTSSHRLASQANLTDFGPVAEISLDDFSNHRLTILSTEIELQSLQKQSRFAAHCEAIAKIQEKLLIKKVLKAKKLAPKPLQPEKIIPATKMARVLWRSGCQLGVSEGFLSYGASHQGVADRRGVCAKTVQRHLSNNYRCDGSPIRDFKKCAPLQSIHINQRLNRYHGKALDVASLSGEDYPELNGKYWRNKEGRWFESKPNIYEPSVQLRKVKFRRSRLLSEKGLGCYSIQKAEGSRRFVSNHEYFIHKSSLSILRNGRGIRNNYDC
ncbi:hypothetical protein [Okeania sp. SIO2B3]|uniref:hypothetical protein n=1 Tax=Okeania sp. SIO2B3 TaxID=2607784 RepID=UPI0013BECF2E|nr:hypothetical protein [Okeania sp. SIO2B3]NET40588.1 hypothetical protein [Okeania sp. SIO2B3]